MPCPELAFGGTRRFWAVREQYDTPVYRAHCRRLAEPVAAQIRADLAAGARVIIVGIDGSPSMGVELTAASEEWGGRPDKPRDEDYPVTLGAGALHRDAARPALGGAPRRPHRRHRPGPHSTMTRPRIWRNLDAILKNGACAMRGDGRSRRVVVVPDAIVNPPPGARDRLGELALGGLGRRRAPAAGSAVRTSALRWSPPPSIR